LKKYNIELIYYILLNINKMSLLIKDTKEILIRQITEDKWWDMKYNLENNSNLEFSYEFNIDGWIFKVKRNKDNSFTRLTIYKDATYESSFI